MFANIIKLNLSLSFLIITDVVGNRQKAESQNRCFIKTELAIFSQKQHFLPPDTLFGKFGVLFFA